MNFHWNGIHREIYSQVRLQKVKKSNRIFKVCNMQSENTSHLLYDCAESSVVWRNIVIILRNITRENIILFFIITIEDVLFGLYKDEHAKY